MKSTIAAILFVIVCAVFPTIVVAEETAWSTLSGRFVFEGEPPEPRTFPVKADADVLGTKLQDESLIVNKEDGGIANIVVYLLPPKSETLQAHPSYERTAKAKVKLTMKQGRFVPRVLLLRTTQTMVQENDDSFGYSPHITFFNNTPM